MAKKDKAGKGKSKSKKTKRTGQQAANSNPNNQKESEFLKCIEVESCRLSTEHFRREYYAVKDQMRYSRELFRKISDTSYEKVEEFHKQLEELTAKQEALEKADIIQKKDIEKATKEFMDAQKAILQQHQQVIDSLEFEYEKRAAELNSNYEFRNISDDTLKEEIELLENKLAAMGMKNQLSIDKMLRRHDSSMKNCALRMDSIINAAEGIASQSQVDSMRQTNFDDIILNKRLKEEVAYLKNDITDLRNQLDVLERENMIKASGNLEIEWNLCYDKFENPDYLQLPEIAMNLKPIYKKHSSLAKVEAIINREVEERNRDDEFSIRGHKAKIIAALDLGPANFYSPLRNSKK